MQIVLVGWTYPIECLHTIGHIIISRRALAREGDYEMMPVCACVRACVR